uniref:Spermatogenesis-associated protein 17 n=1 Tax=Glossina pallidipes TaxID=7398 RepID=A0A1B0A8D6_GLOPL
MYRVKQRSRINSYSSLYQFCYSGSGTMRSFRECMDENFTEANNYMDLERETDKSSEKTFTLAGSELYDYRVFKAARCIQRFVRGWLLRRRLAKQINAAVIIQTEWRRFYSKRLYFRKVEKLAQESIEEHYYRAERKIQALYRGWWSRQYVHDHARLKRVELKASKALLECVAFKLHHFLRKYTVPGVYSLKDTQTLAKVEEFVDSLKYRRYSDYSQETSRQRTLHISNAKKLYKESEFATKVPFAGPDYDNVCKNFTHHSLHDDDDEGRRMSKALHRYEPENNEDPRMCKLRKRRPAHVQAQVSPRTTFCLDLLRSMNKWKMVEEKNLTMERNILDHPQSVKNFLNEIESKWDLLCNSCCFNDAFIKELEKG